MSGHLAVTSEFLLPPTVTLCPQSFEGQGRLGSVNMNPLRSSTIPNNPNNIPNNAQGLDQILPTSATLFHELFHLVLGNDNTFLDTDGEEYNIIKIGKLTASNSVVNPDTYTVMAAAYYYTRNITPVSGHRVEFYGFFTTRN